MSTVQDSDLDLLTLWAAHTHLCVETARGTVAALVIYETAIFTSSASAWQAQGARYAAESLGLTLRSLTALGWRIAE